jgi:ABC-type lipopolysaccharide export system ATPase subunit
MVIGIVKPNGGRILFRGDVVTTMPIYKRSRKAWDSFRRRSPSSSA